MTSRFRHAPGSVHRTVGEAALVLAPGDGGPLVLHGGAAYVWASTAEPVSVADVASTAGVSVGEVHDVVASLVAAGVIVED